MVKGRKVRRRAATCAVMAMMLFVASTALAQVTARVDRDRLVVGETLTLVLQSNDPRQSLETSLDALQGDFAVLDQRSESQMSIVNGQQSATVRLLVTLEPLRSGALTIPALDVGGARTRPITIQVDAAPEPSPGEPEPVFIEVELNPEAGPYYVHAQLGLTLRLFYQQTLTEAAIGQPEVENASVRLLDEVPFQAERNGQRYRVLERRYAIFPERSGSLEIPPMVLSGRLAERDRNRLWQPSGRGRRISVASEPISVEILPRAEGFTGDHWQPARNIRITEQYSVTDGVKVGEPVTRTVIVDAVGLEENMLAEPVWPELENARIYPDQPQGISRDDGEWVLGHKEFRYAVVPETAGDLVLPELNITWWDTVADEQRVSTLPSRTIRVQASDFAGVNDTAEISAAPAVADSQATTPVTPSLGPGYWKWLALGFAALWLVTLWFAVRRKPPAQPSGPTAESVEESRLEAALRQACRRNDAPGARRALLRWSQHYGPGTGRAGAGLLQLADSCNDEALAHGIRELNGLGFSPGEAGDWDGAAFYSRWKNWRKSDLATGSREAPPITDLYAPENRRYGTAG